MGWCISRKSRELLEHWNLNSTCTVQPGFGMSTTQSRYPSLKRFLLMLCRARKQSYSNPLWDGSDTCHRSYQPLHCPLLIRTKIFIDVHCYASDWYFFHHCTWALTSFVVLMLQSWASQICGSIELSSHSCSCEHQASFWECLLLNVGVSWSQYDVLLPA